MEKILITERQLAVIKEFLNKNFDKSNGVRFVSINSLEPAIGEDRIQKPIMAGTTNYSEQNIAKLMEDIKTNGFKEPIIIAYDPETGECSVIEGNHRIEAAKRLGMKDFPASVAIMRIRSDQERAKDKMYPLQRLYIGKGLKPYYPSDLGFDDGPIYDSDYTDGDVLIDGEPVTFN